jgi:hypothetical protein
MPQYFFNVHGAQASLDNIGDELQDDESAWKEATTIAGEIFKDVDGKFRPGQEWSLEVTDGDRKPVFVIRITGQKMR